MSETEETPKRILLFTGDGKGKTTATMGMVLRAAGHNLSIFIIQFIKADSSTGEMAALKTFERVDFIQTGLGFLPDPGKPQFETHRLAAQKGLKIAQEALSSGRYDVVCLDEIATAVSRGLLSEDDVLSALNKSNPRTIIVMTGRGAPQGLIDIADTVTEMRMIKHGFATGHKAQPGVEY